MEFLRVLLVTSDYSVVDGHSLSNEGHCRLSNQCNRSGYSTNLLSVIIYQAPLFDYKGPAA